MSHTKRYWVVLAMGLLALGAAAPEAAAEDGSSEPEEPSGDDNTECVIVDPYTPSVETHVPECVEE